MTTTLTINNQKGSAVETVIIFMLLMMLLFGIIEFGLLLFDKHILTNASREGARAGIVVGLDRSVDEHLTIAEQEASNFCAAYLVGFGSSQSSLDIDASFTEFNSVTGPNRGDLLTVSPEILIRIFTSLRIWIRAGRIGCGLLHAAGMIV